ncbi:MAG: hypothetical protein ALAOOOJD_00511 [bacterium]|nr:hypothetical protein [bacterium]
MLIDCEVVTVEFIQPILRAEPHKPLAVLQNAKHRALRKPLFESEMVKFKVRLLCPNVAFAEIYFSKQRRQSEQA